MEDVVTRIGLNNSVVDNVSVEQIVFTSATVDPPSLTSVSEGSATCTILDVAVGDGVIAFPPYDMQQIAFAAYPSAANTVELTFINTGSTTVNLASGTWKFMIVKFA